MTIDWTQLKTTATQALQHAWAPYSQYRVGAAVMDTNGRIFTGCNIENASYGLTVCAERTAIWNAVSAGSQQVVALAVTAQNTKTLLQTDTLVTPCGACRQVLREFASDVPILCFLANGTEQLFTLAQLLPHSFGPDHLDKTV